MFKSRTFIRLMLVVLLLAVMVVPLAGAAISGLAATDGSAVQAGVVSDQPTFVLACVAGDPGTSGSGCGGG
jgi:hypothetical protein